MLAMHFGIVHEIELGSEPGSVLEAEPEENHGPVPPSAAEWSFAAARDFDFSHGSVPRFSYAVASELSGEEVFFVYFSVEEALGSAHPALLQ